MTDTSTSAVTTTTAAPPAGKPPRGLHITIWVLQVLAAALFIFAGVQKVLGGPEQVQGFEAMGLGIAGMYIVGVLEIAGGVGLLLPGFAGISALCLVALMIGAVTATVGTMGFTPLVAVPVVTLIVVAVIAWVRRQGTGAFLRFAFGR